MLGWARIPGEVKLMITNYPKPGDKVRMIFKTSGVVTSRAQFSKLPKAPIM